MGNNLRGYEVSKVAVELVQVGQIKIERSVAEEHELVVALACEHILRRKAHLVDALVVESGESVESLLYDAIDELVTSHEGGCVVEQL